MHGHPSVHVARLAARKYKNTIFYGLCLAASLVGILVLAVLLGSILAKGLGSLDWQFLTSFPSRFPSKAGLKSALFGSIWLVAIMIPIAFPVGVGTAIYLEEYARRNWLHKVINTNINNLAGVPSIIYGLLGLALFVRWMDLGRSVLAGALTMSLLVLPIIIVASQEAIRSVPDSLRHASYALGASRWQTVRYVVLPAALPGILTGTILAVSRALGETAPMLIVGAWAFIASTPRGPLDPFTVLPMQIYNWTSRPQAAFQDIAAAGIIVLLVVLLVMNAAAIFLRNRYQRRSDA